jgi:hypothetical protein
MNELMTMTAKANFQKFCEVYAKHFSEKRYHSPPAYAHQQFMREVITRCSNGKDTSYRCADFLRGTPEFKLTYFFDHVFPYLEKHGFPTPTDYQGCEQVFEDFKTGFLHAEHGPDWLLSV